MCAVGVRETGRAPSARSGISRFVSHIVRQSTSTSDSGVLWVTMARASSTGSSMVSRLGTRSARSAWWRTMRSRISSS